jgi:hypothetical protein
MRYHESIDYVEFPASDLEAVKVFFSRFLVGVSPIMERITAPSPTLGSMVDSIGLT